MQWALWFQLLFLQVSKHTFKTENGRILRVLKFSLGRGRHGCSKFVCVCVCLCTSYWWTCVGIICYQSEDSLVKRELGDTTYWRPNRCVKKGKCVAKVWAAVQHTHTHKIGSSHMASELFFVSWLPRGRLAPHLRPALNWLWPSWTDGAKIQEKKTKVKCVCENLLFHDGDTLFPLGIPFHLPLIALHQVVELLKRTNCQQSYAYINIRHV